MSFIGIFTRNETVTLYSEFLNLDGTAVIPTSPTVELYQNGIQILTPQSLTQVGTSNIFYYNYTLSASPTEGDVFATFRGTVDGLEGQNSDYFKIDLLKSHVLSNRLGNQRIDFYAATTSDPTRNTVPGVLDYQVISTKYDDASDWSSPTSVKTLYFYYQNSGDINPESVREV